MKIAEDTATSITRHSHDNVEKIALFGLFARLFKTSLLQISKHLAQREVAINIF